MPMRIVVTRIVRLPVRPVSIVGAITIIPPAVQHAAAPRVGMNPPTAAAPDVDDTRVRLREAVRDNRSGACCRHRGTQSNSSHYSKPRQALHAFPASEMPH